MVVQQVNGSYNACLMQQFSSSGFSAEIHRISFPVGGRQEEKSLGSFGGKLAHPDRGEAAVESLGESAAMNSRVLAVVSWQLRPIWIPNSRSNPVVQCSLGRLMGEDFLATLTGLIGLRLNPKTES